MGDLIPLEELKIDLWPPRDQGGQHTGSWQRGVKITHIPSGITVIADHARSQHLNRRIAMDAMEGALTSPGYKTSY